MQSLISNLSEVQQKQLLEDINYLNMTEIKVFCKRHSIPYSIYIETKEGLKRKTSDDDRKGIILNRIRYYLTTGDTGTATCFPASVVCLASLSEPVKASDKLFYGQYEKNSNLTSSLLKTLTNGKFRDGALARILAREFWSKGIAPTYQEFALEWLKASSQKHSNPEWAFLTDRASGKNTNNWKQLRIDKARQVLSVLNSL